MDAVAAYFERFNAGKIDEMADLFGSGYTYAETVFLETAGRSGARREQHHVDGVITEHAEPP
jgi:hypothetical protein